MGNYQSDIDQLKKNAKDMEETFEQWTKNQTEARAKEDSEREDCHKKELEQIANRMKQMEIDLEKKENDQSKENEKRSREKREREQIRAVEREKNMMESIQKLRTEITRMKPGETFEFPDEDIPFPKRLNIGLYGPTGVGKTSLMNSLKFAVNGVLEEYQREQAAPAKFQGGHTTRRMALRITQHLTFVDNRGVAAEDLVKDGAAEELIRQIGEWIQSQCCS